MKILVTGGAGYIGSVVVEQLVQQGESVAVFDNLSLGHREAVHPDADFIHADLNDRPAIDRAIAKHQPDAVMHFAAYSLVGETMKFPFQYLGENVTNFLNLLQSMISHDVKKLILSSTANLFDDPERKPIDETERIVCQAKRMNEATKTLQEVADQFGLTRESDRQIESKVVQKLRKHMSMHIDGIEVAPGKN